MKKTALVAAGFALSGLMVGIVHAGPKDGTRSAQSATVVQRGQKQAELSPYEKSKKERNKRAREKSALKSSGSSSMPPKGGAQKSGAATVGKPAQSGTSRSTVTTSGSGTAPKKDKPKKDGLSKRNKAVIEQSEAAKGKNELLKSGASPTKSK